MQTLKNTQEFLKIGSCINDGVNVSTSSTLILAVNPNRKYALITNDGDNVVYLAFGSAAEMNKGVRMPEKSKNGQFEITWNNLIVGAVYGIHGGSGTNRVLVVEGS